jgi:hypothetical protein
VLCTLVEADRRFWDVYCLNHLGDGDIIVVLMMDAVSISETSVNFNGTTWRNIPAGVQEIPCYMESESL